MLYEIARDERDDALGPERRDHAGRPPAPVAAGEDRALETKRVHQRQKVGSEGRLLARARRLRRQEPGRSKTAQIGNDHAGAGFGEDRRGLRIGVNVVGKPVTEDAGPALGGAVLFIGDLEDAGPDRLVGHRNLPNAWAATPRGRRLFQSADFDCGSSLRCLRRSLQPGKGAGRSFGRRSPIAAGASRTAPGWRAAGRERAAASHHEPVAPLTQRPRSPTVRGIIGTRLRSVATLIVSLALESGQA